MASRDSEVRQVVADLDGLLDDLRANVEALNAILAPPDRDTPPDAKEMVP